MSGRNSRTRPNCARCRNHNINVPLKDHKPFCQWKSCRCCKCRDTIKRQKAMAEQTRIRRAENLERKLAKTGLPVPERVFTPPPESPTNVEDMGDSCSTSSTSPAPVTPRHLPSPPPPPPPPRQPQSAGEMWRTIIKLQELCKLPLNTSPLLHVILSEITQDPEKVLKRFKEATEMWYSIPLLMDSCRLDVSAIPLMFILLSEVSPNAEAILMRIRKAQEELKKGNDISKTCRSQTPPRLFNPLYTTGIPPSCMVASMFHDAQNSAFVPVCPGFLPLVHRSVFPMQEHRSSGLTLVPIDPKYDDLNPGSPSSEYSSHSSISGSVN